METRFVSSVSPAPLGRLDCIEEQSVEAGPLSCGAGEPAPHDAPVGEQEVRRAKVFASDVQFDESGGELLRVSVGGEGRLGVEREGVMAL